MRALTVKQPYADLIMAGVKDVENRTWRVPSTLPQWLRCDECDYRSRNVEQCAGGGWARVPDGPFPFRLWIHAAAKMAHRDDAPQAWQAWQDALGPGKWPEDIATGALLGTVEVTGCHHADECSVECSDDDEQAWLGNCPACRHAEWAQPDCWHWTLANPEPLDVPIPAKGKQGLWTPEQVAP